MKRFLPLFFCLLPAAAQDVDARQLARLMDTLWRSDSSEGLMTMAVTTPNYSRTLEMHVWSLGMDYTLVRILAPRKEKGVSTLKRETEMWNYLPKIKKMVRIPPSMMMSSWMGSDFTNDDLMRESSWEDDYSVETGPVEDGKVDLIFTPRPEAAVTWSKVVTRIDLKARLPISQSFYDEKNRKVRILTFEDVKELDGRTIPTRLVLKPLLEEGRETVVTYKSMKFDIGLEESFFSKSELKKGH